jgi:outer membrane protein
MAGKFAMVVSILRSLTLKKKLISVPALALGLSMLASGQAGTAPTKVGIIHIQNAILATKDGQKAAGDLQTKFGPTKTQIDKMQSDVLQVEDKLKKGSQTLSEDARQQLMRDRDQKATALKRATEDAQAEVEQEEGKIMQELGQRVMQVVAKYATDNGFAIILDVSSQQTPVLWAANGIDITKEIVDLYDKNAPTPPAKPATGAPSTSAPAARPPAAAPPKPTTPPATKKQ